MILIGTILAVWIVCGVIAYSATLAYEQKSFPLITNSYYTGDVLMSLILGILGPIGLGIAVSGVWMFGTKTAKYSSCVFAHGFKFR